MDIEPDAFKYIRCGAKEWTYYQTMVVFLFGTFNGIHDRDELFRLTKISRRLINRACDNLSANGIWKDGITYAEFDGENDWMEIILCTMAATGELNRITVQEEKEEPIDIDALLQKQYEREMQPYVFDRSFMSNSEQNPERSVATGDAQSDAVG